jgi:Zn-dependent peptidase ImmA (M78 family)
VGFALKACRNRRGGLGLAGNPCGTLRAVDLQERRSRTGRTYPKKLENRSDILKDSYTGRQFTLIHELVHLWLNSSGVSNMKQIPRNARSVDSKTEVFYNKTAALVLAPPNEFDAAWRQHNPDQSIDEQIGRISMRFRVSAETIARRLLDADVIRQPDYERLRLVYSDRLRGPGRPGWSPTQAPHRFGSMRAGAVRKLAPPLLDRFTLSVISQLACQTR